ncbi:MAG: hypothetical protein M0035_00750, partial [Actinomycetota bacterium]|nr:hypothetical protein [Actinomycetota bacterium]
FYGGVFAFGDAAFFGSLPYDHVVPSAPIVGITSTPDGRGYWLVGSDGGVFAFGDARSVGSIPASQRAGTIAPLAAPIVGLAPTHDGGGYWFGGADGGVFAYGDSAFDGSLPKYHLVPAAPIVGIAAQG